jgi:hypothetical protein
VRTIAAVAIVNQKSGWPSVPGAAFHDLLCGPVRCRMPRHFDVEDLPVSESDDEEDVKRLEQDRRDASTRNNQRLEDLARLTNPRSDGCQTTH